MTEDERDEDDEILAGIPVALDALAESADTMVQNSQQKDPLSTAGMENGSTWDLR